MAVAAGKKAASRRRYDPDYPLVGETLGLWRLIDGIGRGGMGEVYKAEYDYLHLLSLSYPPDERGRIRRELRALPREEQARLAGEMLGTDLPPAAQFAIKVCSARHGTAGYRRFLQEAALARRLGDHPYIVTVHAIHGGGGEGANSTLPSLVEGGKHKDLAFMVMDLAACDYDYTELSIGDAVHVLRCIATALDHAHRCGVVHRDLKPENLLGSIEFPLLTDFGIAKEVDHSLGLTRTGQIIGTLDYMSPEQATDAKSVDHRSDIYSLGVVLYEYTTGGKLPYIHLAEREAALGAIRSERIEPKWPRQHVAQFPRSLERIILKAMAHRPEDRYQQMSELLSDLDRYMAGDWLGPFGRVGFRRWLRYLRNRYPRSIISGLSLALVGVLIWFASLLVTWLDETRSRLERGLGELRNEVEAIEAHQKQLLGSEQQQETFQRLRRLVGEHRQAYPALAAEFDALAERLAAHRWLRLTFSEDAGPAHPVAPQVGRRNLLAALGPEARLQTSWSEAGLRFTEDHELDLRGFGQDAVYVNILVELPATGTFAMRVGNVDDERRVTSLSVRGDRLLLQHTQDESAPQTLYSDRIPRPVVLDFAVEASVDDLRFYLPGNEAESQGIQGLHFGAARVVLQVPAGTVLKYLEIQPELLPR